MSVLIEQKIICYCNNIDEAVIEEAIKAGAQTLNAIYAATTAGLGPCGGSCRRKIAQLLMKHLSTEPN
jgi:bacterioferritin-associated ferredoxin